MKRLNLKTFEQQLNQANTWKRYGYVKRIVGLTIESTGPDVQLGTICFIHQSNGERLRCEVVGFKDQSILLMPFAELRNIAPGAVVEATDAPVQFKINESLIGQVVDALGNPINGGSVTGSYKSIGIDNMPPDPMLRPPIREILSVGVKTIDSFLTMGKGQRVGIFAGSGVGKSTLMGMIARNASADVNVIALIGERGREVREFIENDLGEEGLRRSVVVVATSDQPALLRLKGAYTATAIAEYFRGEGLNVTLMMDSVTRVAMAQREIGLATGEPPTTKGYTPSVFAILPRLLERTGTDQHGTITAFYNVLVDGDDMNEPIADTVRGILDGHIVLDRKIAHTGQFPAINVLQSISRCMNSIVSSEHRTRNMQFRQMLNTYLSNEDLITIGAYKRGASREIDEAIDMYPQLRQFLIQDYEENVGFTESQSQLAHLLQG
ncbi:MAG: flagellar protein export ATPase FliI [Bacilli bacterium]